MSKTKFIASVVFSLSSCTAVSPALASVSNNEPLAANVKASFASVESTSSPGVLAYEIDVQRSEQQVLGQPSILDSTAPQLHETPSNELGQSPIKYGALGLSKGAYLPLAGALGDSVSTAIAIGRSGVGETNSLVNTSAGGLLSLFAVKTAFIYYADRQPHHIRKPALKLFSGLWNGVTVSNVLVAAGATNPIALAGGATFGYLMYKQEEKILEAEESQISNT